MLINGKAILKRAAAIILVTAMLFSLGGCAGTEPAQGTDKGSKDGKVTFKDALSREITVDKNPKRVVAVSGSFAECWTLAGGTLKGTTEDAKSERNMNMEGVELIGTIKEPNLEKIIAIKPDFVILAADTESHKALAESLKSLGVTCAFFKVELFDDYLNMLNIFTDMTGNKENYKKYGEDVKSQINGVLAKAESAVAPKVLLIRAFATGAKAKGEDNHTGAMLAQLGCENIIDKNKSLLESISMEAVLKEDPDFIFVTTMGASTDKALKYMKENIESSPLWSKLSAVKNNRYIILPKEMFHYKPNARWGEAYEYLYEILYGKEK